MFVIFFLGFHTTNLCSTAYIFELAYMLCICENSLPWFSLFLSERINQHRERGRGGGWGWGWGGGLEAYKNLTSFIFLALECFLNFRRNIKAASCEFLKKIFELSTLVKIKLHALNSLQGMLCPGFAFQICHRLDQDLSGSSLTKESEANIPLSSFISLDDNNINNITYQFQLWGFHACFNCYIKFLIVVSSSLRSNVPKVAPLL